MCDQPDAVDLELQVNNDEEKTVAVRVQQQLLPKLWKFFDVIINQFGWLNYPINFDYIDFRAHSKLIFIPISANILKIIWNIYFFQSSFSLDIV